MVDVTYSYVLNGNEVKDQILDTDGFNQENWYREARRNDFEMEYFIRQAIICDIIDKQDIILASSSARREYTISEIGHGIRKAASLSEKVHAVEYVVGSKSESFQLKDFYNTYSKYEYRETGNLPH